ncbi:hypothetical protein HY229_05345 [Candidatus Acetothermia bacterium]|nr:hypothetical protein [Candidatus Acetothermia bacterium]MBI3643509.1 hypothetical protein [Candidatus Acetothermia bacterium]
MINLRKAGLAALVLIFSFTLLNAGVVSADPAPAPIRIAIVIQAVEPLTPTGELVQAVLGAAAGYLNGKPKFEVIPPDRVRDAQHDLGFVITDRSTPRDVSLFAAKVNADAVILFKVAQVALRQVRITAMAFSRVGAAIYNQTSGVISVESEGLVAKTVMRFRDQIIPLL